MVGETKAAIERIYATSVKRIYGYCLRRLFRQDLAEDAASVVFVRLVERYREIQHRSERETLGWLYGTASNVVAGVLRDERRALEIQQTLARELEKKVARPSADEHPAWPAVFMAIGRLRQRQQDMLVLRFFQGLETSEIAAALGLKHSTVRVDLSRAVKALRQDLENACGTGTRSYS